MCIHTSVLGVLDLLTLGNGFFSSLTGPFSPFSADLLTELSSSTTFCLAAFLFDNFSRADFFLSAICFLITSRCFKSSDFFTCISVLPLPSQEPLDELTDSTEDLSGSFLEEGFGEFWGGFSSSITHSIAEAVATETLSPDPEYPESDLEDWDLDTPDFTLGVLSSFDPPFDF